MTSSKQPVTGRTRDVVVFADKAIFQLAKHWLALANVFWGLYVGLPLLAPVLMDAGMELPARVIYIVYRPLCHQRPERSYFFGGEQTVYSKEELEVIALDWRVVDISHEIRLLFFEFVVQTLISNLGKSYETLNATLSNALQRIDRLTGENTRLKKENSDLRKRLDLMDSALKKN